MGIDKEILFFIFYDVACTCWKNDYMAMALHQNLTFLCVCVCSKP